MHTHGIIIVKYYRTETTQKHSKVIFKDHAGQCQVRHLKNIGPVMELSDWLILVIVLKTNLVM